ncbi:hypothetical protein APHAL10511_000880 [Amanita phalloides]|nr:hypothetical protein APHAL10511_000880 [Amanita phalloides]
MGWFVCSKHPNVVRENSFHSATISDDESPSTSSASTPPVVPSSSRTASKSHHKSLSIGNVAAELLASNSQFLKTSQEASRACLEILQSKEERADRKLKLQEENAKLERELKENEMKVRQAIDILANGNMPEELKKKASEFLMKYFTF